MAPRNQVERGKSVEIERNEQNAHQTPHRWNEEVNRGGSPEARGSSTWRGRRIIIIGARRDTALDEMTADDETWRRVLCSLCTALVDAGFNGTVVRRCGSRPGWLSSWLPRSVCGEEAAGGSTMGVSGRRFHDRYAPELTFSGVKTLSRGATTRHLPAATRTCQPVTAQPSTTPCNQVLIGNPQLAFPSSAQLILPTPVPTPFPTLSVPLPPRISPYRLYPPSASSTRTRSRRPPVSPWSLRVYSVYTFSLSLSFSFSLPSPTTTTSSSFHLDGTFSVLLLALLTASSDDPVRCPCVRLSFLVGRCSVFFLLALDSSPPDIIALAFQIVFVPPLLHF